MRIKSVWITFRRYHDSVGFPVRKVRYSVYEWKYGVRHWNSLGHHTLRFNYLMTPKYIYYIQIAWRKKSNG